MAARSALLWLAAGLAGIALLAPSLRAPEQVGVATVAAPAEAPAPAIVGNGVASFEIVRAADSHFYAAAQVNGAIVRFMVDTGASSVVLTRADALAAGIQAGDFSAQGLGAGGAVRLSPATIGRLALGPLAADNIPAMVAEDKLPISLLGQSYLSRIGSVEIRGDRMVLR